MTRVIIIRHGETEWNLQARYQGQENSPLTARGVAQAEAVAGRLAGLPLDAIISSDLQRAVDTADLIAARHPQTPRFSDERLRERDFGKLTAMTRAEALEKYPEEEKSYLSHDPDYRIPGGESLRDVYDRTAAALDEWAARYEGKTVCIVTHGGVLGQFLRYVLGIPLNHRRAYKFVNCAFTEFTCEDGRWLLHTWGDTHHLTELGAEDDIR
ncbi:histidine phosphatase family protein [Ruficoccus amylovorans]|uniref:Histidine phosphatase family protein n=1 Tax=Ruficoccus amylovorans TaxID=1804625 RepID=A0A842HEQ1_9BACT|nr:histidine phosphatase family protein [Ruficoccus amylovorans]MBC2594126.1 histidine phosphatase family protein [Ruficoccus amylovorans]